MFEDAFGVAEPDDMIEATTLSSLHSNEPFLQTKSTLQDYLRGDNRDVQTEVGANVFFGKG